MKQRWNTVRGSTDRIRAPTYTAVIIHGRATSRAIATPATKDGSVRVTRRSRRVRNLIVLGCSAGAVAIAVGAAAGPTSAPANTLRLGPRSWPGHHGRIGIQGRGGSSTPQALGWASSNWSGYAVTTPSSSPYTGITGQWTVPAVAAARGATYSAAWAGIDGFNSTALVQTGTEQDYYNRSAHYMAWWTTSAQGYAEQAISKPVAPGDAITATITKTGTTLWTISLADTTENWTFTTQVTYTGPGTSAEWIMEAPTISSGFGSTIAPISQYGSPLTFDPGTVTVGTGSPSAPGLVASDGGELIQTNRVVSIPSVPDADADGFNMAYGARAPAAPTS